MGGTPSRVVNTTQVAQSCLQIATLVQQVPPVGLEWEKNDAKCLTYV